MKSIILAIVFCLIGGASFAKKTYKGTKPNIVYILVDDLGYGDVGFNGSTFYETPNIDKLASEGLVLDYSYMYPTCSPSRVALFTGKNSYRTGVYTVPVLEKGTDEENIFSRWTVTSEDTGYSEPLAEEGYKMVHIGKWHLVGPDPIVEQNMDWPIKEKLTQPDPGDYSWVDMHKSDAVKPYYPEGRGYVKNVGGTYRGDPALEPGGYKSETGGYFAPFSNPFLGQKPTDEWLTDRLTDEAIDFIEEYKDEPFFIDLHYYTVHNPLRSRSQELFDKYMAKAGDPITGQGMEKGKKREQIARYGTMIESLDDNVGRLVEYLDKNNLRENTIIIFTSDNGQNGKVNNLLRGTKGYIYEGGIRVPTLVNWPGKVDVGRSSTPVMVMDYFPTFMDLAGINYKGTLDGKSITPLFNGDDSKLNNRPLFWHIASQYKHGACSVIQKDHIKLIQWLATGEMEMYDLLNDPTESNNLVSAKPEQAEQLRKELTKWRKSNQVRLPPNAAIPF
ncbi:sulfatase [Saccharicrinis aurantiacus]|uniref:sulfatase n=1 Tax=Saccharicrinis aurantiacus TaxID=1849719 RepID=UPI00248FE30F|nr:sulfatase [Saccharicrinis aurantiacus]